VVMVLLIHDFLFPLSAPLTIILGMPDDGFYRSKRETMPISLKFLRCFCVSFLIVITSACDRGSTSFFNRCPTEINVQAGTSHPNQPTQNAFWSGSGRDGGVTSVIQSMAYVCTKINNPENPNRGPWTDYTIDATVNFSTAFNDKLPALPPGVVLNLPATFVGPSWVIVEGKTGNGVVIATKEVFGSINRQVGPGTINVHMSRLAPEIVEQIEVLSVRWK
jgi:hypothetical protein